MPLAQADLANTALRMFLQEMGRAYDEARGLTPYKGREDFIKIQTFFEGRCCYCDTEFDALTKPVQDHLIAMNKTSVGLHAWGNIVPACGSCNATKHARGWQDFIAERAGIDAPSRRARVLAMLDEYGYNPTTDLRTAAAELYEEVGGMSMTLIRAKAASLRDSLS